MGAGNCRSDRDLAKPLPAPRGSLCSHGSTRKRETQRSGHCYLHSLPLVKERPRLLPGAMHRGPQRAGTARAPAQRQPTAQASAQNPCASGLSQSSGLAVSPSQTVWDSPLLQKPQGPAGHSCSPQSGCSRWEESLIVLASSQRRGPVTACHGTSGSEKFPSVGLLVAPASSEG